jgi:hypothetical protein
MRMKREPCSVIGRILRIEMIQQQKRIDMVESARSDGPFEPDTRPFNYGLRLYDFHNASRQAHG